MEKIKSYIDRFFKTNKKNMRYGMYANEIVEIRDALENKPFDVVIDVVMLIFDYGYAKGYRAAMAKMKKAFW